MMLRGLVWLALAGSSSAFAQTPAIDPEVLSRLAWRNIGPALMGGRTADVEGVPGNPYVVYVGSASGGVWKTENGGTTWKPLFDDQPVASIGDLALEPGNPDVVYVGTGESNLRNSVSFGNGVYKTTDGGKTWRHLGLSDTRHISRVLVSPRDPSHVYVGAVGHAFGRNEERGVFLSTDGGESWEKVLYVDDGHGVADMDIDPENPNVLYAAMWRFERTPWTHTSGSEDGGVFRSVDGGRTWKKLEKGLPQLMGRIGVKVAPSNPRVVYVICESNEGTLYRSNDRGESFTKVHEDPQIVSRGFYYTDLRVDPSDENRVYAVASRLFVSVDGGKTFERISPSTHVDYHSLWIDPEDPRRMWQGQDGGVAVSYDRGETWEYVNRFPLAQFYQIYADHREPFYHLGGGLQDNGTWSGPSRTREPFGILNKEWQMVSFGDGFHIVADPDDPDLFLTEYQGGGLMRTDMKSREQIAASPQPRRGDGGPVGELEYRFNWNAPIVPSPHDGRIVYFGGNVLFRTEDFGLSWKPVSPDLTTNDPEKQIAAGGPVWVENTTAEYHTTIISAAESPLTRGVLWAGTDDGNLQVSRDDGESWEDVTQNVPGVPPLSPVSHVEPSRTAAGTAYVSFDRHMFNDLRPYVYKTSDFGRSFTAITGNLPETAYVWVVREDPKNPKLLYAGTEIGLYVSHTGGGEWMKLHLENLPTVAVHDLLVHPRDNDIVLGTHGRGLWIFDDATPIQTLSADLLKQTAHLFDVRPAVRFTMRPTRYGIGDVPFRGPNPPYGALITYYLQEEIPEEEKEALEMEILDASGAVIRRIEKLPRESGLNRVAWDLQYEPPRPRKDDEDGGNDFFDRRRGPQALPGTYRVRLTLRDQSYEKPVQVRLDPTVEVSASDLQTQFDAAMKLRDWQSLTNDALRGVDSLKAQIDERKKTLATLRKQDAEALTKTLEETAKTVDAVSDRLARPSGKPFWSEGPRLVERLQALMGSLDGVNAAPTAVQLEYLQELREEARTELAAYNELLATRVAELNRELESARVPPLLVPEAVSVPE